LRQGAGSKMRKKGSWQQVLIHKKIYIIKTS
jgi:hypothetical protein